MKKLFTLLIALLCIGMSVEAKTRNFTMGTPAGNGAWDAESMTYSWTLGYSNLATIFDCNSDNLAGYTKLHLETSDYVTDCPYRVCFMNGGTAVATISLYSAGVKDLIFAERGETKDIDLSKITHISFGGASSSGSIKLLSAYLEGPDRPLKAIVSTSVGNDVKNLTGTNTNWSNTVSYPKTFQSQGEVWGDGDGSGQGSHVNIADYSKMSFYVSKGSDKGLALRVWIWNGSGVVTLYAHPDADYETATFTQPYEIKEPGVYSVNVSGYQYLKGVKAANKWDGQTPIVVDYAWMSNGEEALAIDEARTFSFGYPLDFSGVTDLEAYIATNVTESKVTMTKVEGSVPANTGLVMKQTSDKAVVTIPVVGAATEDVSANLLVATTASTNVPAGAYVLAGSAETLGWYYIGANPATLPAGKAYLAAPTAAKQLQFVWSDDATKADDVVAETTVEDGAWYTITGMKVTAPTNGLYIHNGKKVSINK